MGPVTMVMLGLVMLLHVYIALLETVFYRTRGVRVFAIARENVELLRPAMSNQGCYNTFLALALMLALVLPGAETARAFGWYGLGCVAIAGLWGGATVSRRIIFVQTVPAVLGLLALATGV